MSVLGSYDTLSQCFTLLLSIFVTMSLSKPIGVVSVNTWTRMLTSAVKTIIMKLWDSPGTTSTWSLLRSILRQRGLPRRRKNAEMDPGTMKIKTWYRNRLAKVMILSFRLQVASDALSATDRTSDQAREPFEDDEERLAMKQGDMPPPVPERVANPRIREFEMTEQYRNFNQTRTRCTVPPLMTPSHKHG